jgi:hypothetical protein
MDTQRNQGIPSTSQRHKDNLALPDPEKNTTPNKLPDEADPSAIRGDQYVMADSADKL